MTELITNSGLDLPIYDWDTVVRRTEMETHPGSNFVRDIRITHNLAGLLGREGLKKTLAICEEEFTEFASACKASVVPRSWGLTRWPTTRPNKGSLEPDPVPGFRLVAEVEKIEVVRVSEVQEYARRAKIGWGFLDYKLNKRQYVYTDRKIDQFTYGTSQLKQQTTDWLTDIDLYVSPSG